VLIIYLIDAWILILVSLRPTSAAFIRLLPEAHPKGLPVAVQIHSRWICPAELPGHLSLVDDFLSAFYVFTSFSIHFHFLTDIDEGWNR
jgi:hypothetical protein